MKISRSALSGRPGLVGKVGDSSDCLTVVLKRELLVSQSKRRGESPRGGRHSMHELIITVVERGHGVGGGNIPDVGEDDGLARHVQVP